MAYDPAALISPLLDDESWVIKNTIGNKHYHRWKKEEPRNDTYFLPLGCFLLQSTVNEETFSEAFSPLP